MRLNNRSTPARGHRLTVTLPVTLPVTLTLALTATLVLCGCSGSTDNQGDQLVIWINSDKGYNGLAEIGEQFTRKTGVPVVVEHPQNATNKFQQAASSGKGPDIFIWPHDRLGEWHASGLLAEVQPSAATREVLEQKGWDAFTIGGRLWGYPMAFEAVGLLYNKRLIAEPPTSFAEIPAIHERLGSQGKRAILWEFGKVFFSYALISAGGGYAFKRRANGTYDASDVGVDAPGAIAGLQVLSDLIEGGIMPRSATYNHAESSMADGSVAMMIGGPWSWNNLQAAGIELGVAPIPAVGEYPARPFVGVLGAMISQASRKRGIAAEFLEHYVLTAEGLAVIDADKPIGVPAHKLFYQRLASDPRIRATMLSVRDGVLMPNNAEMGRFWPAMDTALENVAQGRQSPADALASAGRRMRQE